MKICPAIQQIAYLAPLGRAITLGGIVYGKGFERKKEYILFSLKTFSHKTVSNHSVVTLLSDLSGLEHSWLQECGREIKRQGHAHQIAWAYFKLNPLPNFV